MSQISAEAINESVVRKWKRYPAYKDSGFELLREIPAKWKMTRLKYGYEICLGKMLQPQPSSPLDTLEAYLRSANVSWEGIDISNIKEMWFSPYEKSLYELKCGDLLISEGGDVGRSAIWMGELSKCYIQNAVHRVRNKEGYSNKFLYYWMFFLKAVGYIDLLCNKATIAHFTAEKVKEIPVTHPVFPEQQVIASFLDRETSKIDTLIAKKEQLIQLLQEKRTVLISHAVTKGLNPSAPMKDSGVEWLGEIPAHWEVKKIKHLTFVVSKGTTPTTIGAEFINDGIRFLKAENLVNGIIVNEPAIYIDELTHHLLRRSILNEQDILMVIAGATTGKVAIVNQSHLPANTNQAVAFVRPRNRGTASFLLYWLGNSKIQEQVWLKAVQAAQPNLSLEDIKNFSCPVPALGEAIKIVKYLDSETNKIDTLITKIRTGIEQMKEYRIALISSAVTGKIDVHEEAAV